MPSSTIFEILSAIAAYINILLLVNDDGVGLDYQDK